MKTLSPLAAAILPMLTKPLTAEHIWRDMPDGDEYAFREIVAALDEVTDSGDVGCDEHEGTAYYYRRDVAAEQARLAAYADAVRVATHARDMALALARANFAAACEAAEEERDAADPMAAIKGAVVA